MWLKYSMYGFSDLNASYQVTNLVQTLLNIYNIVVSLKMSRHIFLSTPYLEGRPSVMVY